MATYKDKEFQLNELDPYMNQVQAAEAMKGAGLQNIMGGVQAGSQMYLDQINYQKLLDANTPPPEKITDTGEIDMSDIEALEASAPPQTTGGFQQITTPNYQQIPIENPQMPYLNVYEGEAPPVTPVSYNRSLLQRLLGR